MSTIVLDDEVQWTQHPPRPGFVRQTVRESLAKGFEPEAEFFVYEGSPHVVWGMWDYAECWGPGPVHEVHPYLPHWRGTQVTEVEFRVMVKAIHGIAD
jgi:hypothetical protein